MKKLNKKILLVIGSILSLFFVFLQTKDNQLLNDLSNVNTANADVIPPPPDPGCSTDGCGSSGGGSDGGLNNS